MDISCSELVDSFGLVSGDVVHVSSDLFSLMLDSQESQEPVTPNRLINEIQYRIGEHGTLLLPTFSWDFCHGKGYNYKKTVCKTGSLGRLALKRSDFRRTLHPIYSFAVWGKDQTLLCNMNNVTSWGSDSPFAYMHNKNAKAILIDVDYANCFTFVHHVEEMSSESIDYRYQKTFTGNYTDENEASEIRSYKMFVRKLDLEVIGCVNKIGEILELKGAACKYKIFNRYMRIVELGNAYPLIEKDILENSSRNICTYIGQGHSGNKR